MGLLDDAIREHLELMRSRGADPGRVARMEDEVLEKDEESQAISEWSEDAASSDIQKSIPDPPVDIDSDQVPEAPPLNFFDAPEVEFSQVSTSEEQFDESTELAESETWSDRDGALAGGEFPTTGEEFERNYAEGVESYIEEPPPMNDLLDQTPEFLEETPEHDRLWFDQKSPKDFNFGD